jgi:hypothetical protein
MKAENNVHIFVPPIYRLLNEVDPTGPFDPAGKLKAPFVQLWTWNFHRLFSSLHHDTLDLVCFTLGDHDNARGNVYQLFEGIRDGTGV